MKVFVTWLMLALAVLMLALTNRVNAAVVDSGPVSIAIPNTIDGLYLDLVTGTASSSSVGNGGWDINAFGTIRREFFFRPTSSSTGCYRTPPLANGCDALPLGRIFGLGSPFSPGGFVGFSNFDVQQTRTVGFRFLNEATGQVNYGYMFLNALGATGLDATITRYTYEDSGSAIAVGGNNQSPTIVAATGLAARRGSPRTNVIIATVNDDDGAGTVRITRSGGSSALILSNVVNSNGVVTADIEASCSANSDFYMLTAFDFFGITATATLNISTLANTAPTLGSYGANAVNVGASTTVVASAAPADNGSIATISASAPGFVGSLSVDPVTGVVSIGNAGPAGVYSVTVTATDNCGVTSSSAFSLTVNVVNLAPTITAVTGLSRQRGSLPSSAAIATVSDDGGAGAVTVTGAAITNGIRLNNIVNTDGSVTARLVAGCLATPASFPLFAVDAANATAMATLDVALTANTAPVLGNYGAATVFATAGTVVMPSTAPIDNGLIEGITVSAPGFTGTLTVDPVTGKVSIANAGPIGTFTVTLNATDNCSEITSTAFSLTVTANAPPTILAATGLSRQQGSPAASATIATVSDDGGDGSVVVTGAGLIDGVRLNTMVNANGTVSGELRASCNATPTSFALTATDSVGATATTSLSIAVIANAAPNLGSYGATSVNAGSNTIATADAAPSDNGTINTLIANAPGFNGTLTVDPLTGNVAVGNAGPVGTYTVTVGAADNCGTISTRTFALTVNSTNLAPAIVASTGLTRQQGSPAANSTIASVVDDGGNGAVVVSVNGAASATVNGISLGLINNIDGVVNAMVIASCSASNAAFTLTARDSGSPPANSATTLNITAAANTPPNLGSYPARSVGLSTGGTVSPTANPSDNGSISTQTIAAPGFSGTLAVNTSTGVITMGNAGPIGNYNVTVTATDNCGASTSTTFLLNVTAPDLSLNLSALTQQVNAQQIGYLLTVSNAGPAAVNAATVASSLPADLTNIAWTCNSAGGTSCPANGSGNIGQVLSLPGGASATFLITAQIGVAAGDVLVSTATVTPIVDDPTPGNNAATVTTQIWLFRNGFETTAEMNRSQ